MKLKGQLLEAWDVVGGLSSPSKMPCYSYSIPAQKCLAGSKLRDVENSVCNKCYAFVGFYNYPNPKKALEKRYLSLTDPRWVASMTTLIGALEHSGYFRFHDSGDIQSAAHLENICQIARNLPHIKFWLPTKEIKFLSAYIASGKTFPKNLTVRLSAYIIDGSLPRAAAKNLKIVVSGVTRGDKFTCPSSNQDGVCGTCRNCWSKKVKTVIYKKH